MSNNNSPSIQLEDLNYFWTKSGVPCFMADRENIEELVEQLGFNIYYLICNIAEDREVKKNFYDKGVNKTETTYVTDIKTSIVKIVNNFVGRSVSEVKDEDIYDFTPVRETAEYNLPPIPHTIVSKLDEFFRLVDAQHGTEAIVILTFDPNFTDSSGWGVLVPEQTNTSVHCKYEADSIVDQKPDHVLIVGSVHSHPKMAAYASGTDHADQADFDGIHITYGWQNNINGGATQYHIELQMSGQSWVLKPEDVFEEFTIKKDPDPQVIEWTQNVKKVLPPTGGYQSYPATTHNQYPNPHLKQRDYTPLGTTKGDPSFQTGIPKPDDPNPFIVIAEMDYNDDNDYDCPACGYMLALADFAAGYCPVCDIAFCDAKDSYSEILMDTARYLRARGMSENCAYYLWTRDTNGSHMLMKLADAQSFVDNDPFPDTLIKSSSATIVNEYSPYDTEIDNYNSADKWFSDYSEERTVCCNVSTSETHLCKCYVTVLYEDILDFDRSHPHDIYERNSKCENCEYFYSRQCESYHNAVIDHAVNGISLSSPIKPCENFVEYSRNYSHIY